MKNNRRSMIYSEKIVKIWNFFPSSPRIFIHQREQIKIRKNSEK